MDEIKLKIKKMHPDAKIPSLSHDDDAGYDITVIDDGTIELEEIESEMMKGLFGANARKCFRVKYIEYRTGLAIEPPPGYHIEIVARSSVSKYDIILANCLAIGDGGYRNEYKLRFRILPLDVKMQMQTTKEEAIKEALDYIHNNDIKIFKKGERAAQILLRKTEHLPIQEVEELTDTERGLGGFGSTGKA